MVHNLFYLVFRIPRCVMLLQSTHRGPWIEKWQVFVCWAIMNTIVVLQNRIKGTFNAIGGPSSQGKMCRGNRLGKCWSIANFLVVLMNDLLRLKIWHWIYHIHSKMLRLQGENFWARVHMCKACCLHLVMVTCPMPFQVILQTPCVVFECVRVSCTVLLSCGTFNTYLHV